jgi:hypothetical protein
MDTTLVVVMVVGAALAVTGVSSGVIVGYWRGRKRGILLAAHEQPELDVLAGVGGAILGAQLKVDALCEVVYQQATRIVDTRNFQIGLFEGHDYAIKVWLKDAERLEPRRFENKANDGIIGWVRQTGNGLLVRDFQREWETLPAKPTHSGNLDNLLLVTEREARKIAVIDGDTNKLLGHIEASYRAHGYT